VGFHRAHVVLFDEARERMTLYCEWSAPGVPRVSMRDAPVREAGWPVTAAASGERVMAGRADIERRAPAARRFIDDEGLESVILLPLCIEGRVVGAIGFQRRVGCAPLPHGIEARLNLVGEMVANALARKRADEQRQAAFEELARLKRTIEHERDYLREEIQVEHGSGIVGSSPGMARVLELVLAVARTKATVLVHGESGVGKELVARAIHAESERAAGPLVKVNCASIPKELFESEFFGHMRGSFTGAHQNRLGRFELADGGTLFLDEAGEIPIELQAKFLRVLQDSEFERVGDDRTRRVDVRIVAATNRDLAAEVQGGRFRRDLYYRLSVFPIEVPPLRARREDILPLAEHFLALSSRALGRGDLSLDADQKRLLTRYDWPGNVRELSHVVERAAILSRGGKVNLEAALSVVLEPPALEGLRAGVILKEEELRSIERRNLLSALEKAEWRISGASGAAELLGLRPSTLRDRMKALGIQKQA
jgi:transcriptional regulator with GAF, ATPase, and Fis domain